MQIESTNMRLTKIQFVAFLTSSQSIWKIVIIYNRKFLGGKSLCCSDSICSHTQTPKIYGNAFKSLITRNKNSKAANTIESD